MTVHVHDPAPRDVAGEASATRPVAPIGSRWLLPGLVGAAVVAGLVVAGVLSVEAVLYIGLFGGMLLMHAGGHGHGGHGGGHAGHGVGGDSASANLRSDSSDVQPDGPASGSGLGSRAGDDSMEDGTKNVDRHTSHGCCG